ncbi:hypothetical protein PGT21_021897 [Puccinia graminis f. sp. tritici]|uniref:Uncharacterized protein n=1 Tax=Puccinia graminis f. sp. tritici TaxID=56615 RepID=A0A5B0QC29_PUCGR|nr:hypothetical protein PGT21_021897 [Puccinia graminis f. sp. tritici]
MKLDISDLLWQELTSKYEPNIARFITSLSSNVDPFRHERIPGLTPRMRDLQLTDSIQEFAHLLWCVNSKFLRTFKASDKAYLQEQLAVQDWINHLLGKGAKSERVSREKVQRKATNSDGTEDTLRKCMQKATSDEPSHSKGYGILLQKQKPT